MIWNMILNSLHVGKNEKLAFVAGQNHRFLIDKDTYLSKLNWSLVWINDPSSLNYYLEDGTDPDGRTGLLYSAEIKDLDCLYKLPPTK